MAFKFQAEGDLAREAFRRSRAGLIAIGLASALINVLYLTSSFFMLQVYDRVIPSHSIPSLIALGILAGALYIFQGGFELIRNRMLTRVAGVFDEVLGQRVFKVMMKTPIKTSGANDGLAVMRDFDQVRTFLSGTGPSAFFDLPWMPVYIAICFLFHPVVGIIAIVGALVLIFITVLTNFTTQASDRKLHDLWNQRNVLMGAALRNAEVAEPLALPAPRSVLSVQKLATGPANAQQLIVSDVSFTLRAGSAVGVIGPSGSGKSSLSRALTGIWPIYRGSVRLDGAALDQWDEGVRGDHIGYLPQNIELFSGTVAQNIARYRRDWTPEAVVAAARAARVHDLILNLPQGYDTDIGVNGCLLSAGQRQRVALARALYGNPFLVILDEPNSNLDTEGEEALSVAIGDVRARGGIVIVIAHRPSALVAVDHVLMMKEGRAVAFGLKEEVLPKFLRKDSIVAAESRPVTLKVVGESSGMSRE